MLRATGVVGTVRIDAQLKGADRRQVHAEVFKLLRRALRTEIELLPPNLLQGFSWGRGKDGKLLAALRGSFDDVKLDALKALWRVEDEADDL